MKRDKARPRKRMMTVGEFRSQFPEEGACARYLVRAGLNEHHFCRFDEQQAG